ncbi:MAG: DUF2721 domain-containing protein [Bernardetiaceae bacterium]|nr:DUF2721 domain-containing protein [Bernardetiaceae bacterium]
MRPQGLGHELANHLAGETLSNRLVFLAAKAEIGRPEPPGPVMELSLNVPAFIFPTISLLMLAYTNRFLAIASLTQIKNLRYRLYLIRNMQMTGVISLFCSVTSMFFIFENLPAWGTYSFAASLVLLLVSLSLSIAEIISSIKALNIQLEDIEDSQDEIEVHP